MRSHMKTKKKQSKMARREARNFYVYIAPWLVGFIVLTLYPMLYSLYLSFTDMNLAGKGKIVGFEKLGLCILQKTRCSLKHLEIH